MNDDDTSVSRSKPAVTQRLKRDDFPHPPADKHGGLPLTVANVRHLLREYGVDVGWNVHKKRLTLTRQGVAISPQELTSLGNLNGMRGLDFWDFVSCIAQAHPSNEIRDWIKSAPWDGHDRLPEIIATVTPSDGYPEGLAKNLLRRWLLSVAAAAVMAGGDIRLTLGGVLTFQGGQGIGKTTWFSNLLPSGHLRDSYQKRDHHLDPHNRDSVIVALGHLIVEIGELDGVFRRDIARLKGFLTANCDKPRLLYAKNAVEFPRTTVFGASVNDDRFLVDPTGNRRFWTIAVKKLDYNHQVNLQQLYAQLALDIERGEQWWLTQEEEAMLVAYNKRHLVISPIAERLDEYVDLDAIARGEGPYLTALEVLRKLDIDRPTMGQCKEMGAALRNLIGPPKRVQGRDKWRVPANAKEYFAADAPEETEAI